MFPVSSRTAGLIFDCPGANDLMIKWNLNRVMADKRIRGNALAQQLGVHPNTVYRLRNAQIMPSIDGKFLAKLCELLDCHFWDLLEEVSPDAECST